MKKGRRPTREQKIAIKANGLDPNNWLVIKKTPDDLTIVNKKSKNVRTIRY
ncbi:MAG: hypothetical protein KHW49_02815 [Eubacterium sp.]|jgi:hypothetical protein|nr:hypothetical protein [Eubacterium sp.]